MSEREHRGNGRNHAPLGMIARLGGSVGRVAAGVGRALRPRVGERPQPIVARTWWGTTHADDADRYLDYLERTGLREYRDTEGNRGVIALRRVADGRADFLLISFWESPRAVRNFAGDQPDRARFYPEDERFLLEGDEHVTHYEVVFEDRPVTVDPVHA